jgi:hypothetical protein
MNKIPFEELRKEVERVLRKSIDDISHGDIFTKRLFIEVYIAAISNIAVDFFENREKLSKDSLLRLWDLLPEHHRERLADIIDESHMYNDIEFDRGE